MPGFLHVTPRRACGVIMLRKAGLPYGQIRAISGLHKETIHQVLKRAVQHPEDPTATRPRSGAPKKLSLRDERHLVRTAVNNRNISITALCKQFSCCAATMKAALSKYGYHKRVARRKPFLTANHKKKRLAFAQAHEYWEDKDWERVMFTDECNIKLGLDGRVYWIWQRADEEFHEKCLKSIFKSGRTSVGIWSFIFKDQKGPLV